MSTTPEACIRQKWYYTLKFSVAFLRTIRVIWSRVSSSLQFRLAGMIELYPTSKALHRNYTRRHTSIFCVQIILWGATYTFHRYSIFFLSRFALVSCIALKVIQGSGSVRHVNSLMVIKEEERQMSHALSPFVCQAFPAHFAERPHHALPPSITALHLSRSSPC